MVKTGKLDDIKNNKYQGVYSTGTIFATWNNDTSIQNKKNPNYFALKDNESGAWCAHFVSWCADRAGLDLKISFKECNGFKSCQNAVNAYRKKGLYINYKKKNETNAYVPKKGDLIFFSKNSNSKGMNITHVGIVLYSSVEGKKDIIYTIEGNRTVYRDEKTRARLVSGVVVDKYETNSRKDKSNRYNEMIINGYVSMGGNTCGEDVKFQKYGDFYLGG